MKLTIENKGNKSTAHTIEVTRVELNTFQNQITYIEKDKPNQVKEIKLSTAKLYTIR